MAAGVWGGVLMGVLEGVRGGVGAKKIPRGMCARD
jgi:hypothetical protein